jgi:hypothetical protein
VTTAVDDPTPTPSPPTLRERLEPGRFVLGSLAEVAIKAYGAGAAAAVALSDSETVGGKAKDAIAAVPSLAEEYRNATYVVDHQEEIRSALDYINENTPPREELEASADEATATLRDLETTYTELGEARDSLGLSWDPRDWDPRDTYGHLTAAWDARPDLDSIQRLADLADQVSPYLDQVQPLAPLYYGGLLAVVDNFASDEIAGTIFVMALALVVSLVLAHAMGFWVRRGRPGLIATALQRLGARTWRPWYVDNLPMAMGPELYDAARERIHGDVVADPEAALDPASFRELEAWFAERRRDELSP